MLESTLAGPAVLDEGYIILLGVIGLLAGEELVDSGCWIGGEAEGALLDAEEFGVTFPPLELPWAGEQDPTCLLLFPCTRRADP